MEEFIIKEFENRKGEFKKISINDIKERLEELNIDSISVNNGNVIRATNGVLRILYNDYDNPLVLHFDYLGVCLYINPDWYVNNQEDVDDIVDYICHNNKKDKLDIFSGCLIDDKLIYSICQNKNLKMVSLAPFDKKSKYLLSKKHYKMIKNSEIKSVKTIGVEEELKENYDPIIWYNSRKLLIGNNNYADLHTQNYPKNIIISKCLSIDELYNLKYLSSSVILNFNDDSYINIEDVIHRLKELGYNNRIVIDIIDKELFNKFILNKDNIDYDNIYINSDNMEVSLKNYLRFEKQLYEMIEPAKELSPFERYIFAYNKVKKFKKYRENEEDRESARNLYSILENKYMVCVGFAKMFGDLLNKLGIPNKDIDLDVDTSYDEIDASLKNIPVLDKTTEMVGHARRYVYIKDDKYDIDGFYISDPTWDNDLEHDFYNHLAFTDEEASFAKRYIWIYKWNSSELFNVNSIEDFYKKINFLLSRDNFFKGNIKNLVNDLINNQINLLDKTFVEELKNKYSFIDEYNWPSDINDLLYDLGDYIVKHTNKELSGSTIIDAVENVYKNAYGYNNDELEEKISSVIYDNKKEQEKCFPKRYRTDSDGHEEVYINEINKFDIDNNNRSK